MAKEWKREASVKAAIKREGISGMSWRTVQTMTGWNALFYVHDAADKADIEARGFNAKIDPAQAAK